jgi:Bacterial SH3 domain
MMSDFRVISAGLNLRSSGEVVPGNIIAVLPQGQIVTRIGSEPDSEKWWQVGTILDGSTLEGFVSKSYLSPLIKLTEKVLWVVNYPSIDWFVDQAVKVKATAVAIRTDNDLNTAISTFHGKGIKVYGWRWPSAERVRALKEAKNVVDLLHKGLDGYYVDPEGEPEQHYDWNQKNLESIAEDFCKAITTVSTGKPFGTTSHFRGKKVFDKLPWNSFFKYSNVFLPQAYWKASAGTINGGDAKKNYRQSLDEWEATGAARDKIVPMAGELEFSTPAQIKEYAEEAKKQGVASLHFYTATKDVKSEVWDAVKKAGE